MTDPITTPITEFTAGRIEILSGCPDEAETAAIVAAVLALQAESSAVAPKAPALISPWHAAALSESVSRSPLEQPMSGPRRVKGVASLWPG